MPSYDRFKLALTGIEGTQWRLFERLATVFLAAEYPSLRPVAAASGDGGMDASLFQASDDPQVALQFSVRKDWDAKVRQTCARLAETAPDTRLVIFGTNQEVGPNAAAIKKSMRKEYGYFVDIRDVEWFLTHRNRSAAVSSEADEFCAQVADPILSEGGALSRQAQALDDLEAKAAFVYLGLQWEDDTREKGLTKLCFEAIVRAVLRETTSEHRMTRQQVRVQVAKLLPAHHDATRDAQVDGALNRSAKVHIRHWRRQDEFCLTWAERCRLTDRLAQMEALDVALRAELMTMIIRASEEFGLAVTDDVVAHTIERSRSVLERVLLDRGEAFAEAVTNDLGAALRFEDVEAVVYNDLAVSKTKLNVEPRVVAATVLSLLVEPPDEVRKYLRSLADTYTLFAFMRETPDVQSAVVKIFSEGDIWLDTTVVLPLFAEELLDENAQSHTLMLRAAAEAGLKLYVTEGVLEELAAHIHRSRGFFHAASRGDTYGNEPFLLSCYRLSGHELNKFEHWLQTFCGMARPEDDIADYLADGFKIGVSNLREYVDKADSQVVAMVGEIWHEARDVRDKRTVATGGAPIDAGTRARLVGHDVENYVGAQMRREERGERRSAFGFKTWWLTLDGTAFRVAKEMADKIEGRPLPSPAISPDFMLHYLAVGPIRARLSRRTEEALPLMLNMSVLDAVPRDLLDLSDELRKELIGLPPHVVRRKIRDTLDEARRLLGARAKAGERGLTEEIKSRLIEQAKTR